MNQRKLKITGASRTAKRGAFTVYSHMVSELRLAGRWLEDAGFKIGEPVTVEILNGSLVVTKWKPTPIERQEGVIHLPINEFNKHINALSSAA